MAGRWHHGSRRKTFHAGLIVLKAVNTQTDSFHIQKRDIALLRGLFESRVMNTDQLAAIFFHGKREYAKKCLQKLKADGLIQERKRLVNEKSILFLTRKAFTKLRNAGALAGYPALSIASFERRANVSDFTVRHELSVMDVKAAFHTAIRKNGKFSITEFNTWPRLFEFKGSKPGRGSLETLAKPDGFFRLLFQNDAKSSYFLEVDRSTEAQSRLIAQALCYRQYYYSGGFAVRNGATREKFKKHPFRVLMVLKNAERRNNTAERLLRCNPPILSLVWLATLAEATMDPLGPIWIQPRDYLEAIKGTPFDNGTTRRGFGYKRQAKREILVENHVKKSSLLG